MKNTTTLEDVIEEVCLRTDSEDDSIFPVVTIGKHKKEESYSDYFLSLPLVESVILPVKWMCVHTQCFIK